MTDGTFGCVAVIEVTYNYCLVAVAHDSIDTVEVPAVVFLIQLARALVDASRSSDYCVEGNYHSYTNERQEWYQHETVFTNSSTVFTIEFCT